MDRTRLALFVIALLATTSMASGQGVFGQNKPKPAGPTDSRAVVDVSVIPLKNAVARGGDLPIAIVFDILDHSDDRGYVTI